MRKSVPVSSASRLVLNAEFGSITVRSAATRNVDVDVYFRGYPPSRADFDRMLHDFTFEAERQGSEIRVTGKFKDGRRSLWNGQDGFGLLSWIFGGSTGWLREIEYNVTVPAEFSAELGTSGGSISVDDLRGDVDAHTSGGSLNLGHIDGAVKGRTSGGSITLAGGKGKAVVHTSGGSIRIGSVAGDVEATTSGGSISVDHASGRVNAHTSGGRINVQEVTGAIDASTSGGSVSATLLAQPKEDCRLSSSGGSINVNLGRDVHVNVNASTSGGHVSTDYAVPLRSDRHQRELEAPLNGGGPLLYLRTSGGSINIRHADSTAAVHDNGTKAFN